MTKSSIFVPGNIITRKRDREKGKLVLVLEAECIIAECSSSSGSYKVKHLTQDGEVHCWWFDSWNWEVVPQ